MERRKVIKRKIANVEKTLEKGDLKSFEKVIGYF